MAGWSDSGNWTSKDNLRMSSIVNRVYGISLAVDERCGASGISKLSFTKDNMYLSDIRGFTNQIQTKVSSLITAYVNHTDNSGFWDGKATIPTWTEADILTEIGDPTRLELGRLENVIDWEWQQYEILNLLIWIKAFGGAGGNNLIKRSNNQTTWALAESALISATPASWGTVAFFDYLGQNNGATSFLKNYGTRTFSRTPVTSMNHDTDVYIYTIKNPASLTYETGFGYVQDAFNIYAQETNITGVLSYTPDIDGADGSFTEPSPIGDDRSITGDPLVFIEKYNVVNGFTFKDW